MLIKIEKEMDLAKKGLTIWKEILNKNDIKKNDKVILMLETLNCSNEYIKKFFKASNIIDKALFFLIADDKGIKKSEIFPMDCFYEKIIYLTLDEYISIIKLYNLYMFTDQLFIISRNMPIGRTGYNLVRNKLLTEEEYMKIALLNNI